MNRLSVITTLILLSIIAIGAWYYTQSSAGPELTLAQAKTLAQKSECTLKGSLGENGSYNSSSNTWSIDFTPSPQYVQSGCSPTCVVAEATGSAEINWRCTGAIEPASKDDLITLDSPLPRGSVQSPLTIRGKARGNWYFEASFPVKLYDANRKLLSQGIAQAQSDWMTTEFVPFVATLTFTPPSTATGMLVLEKDNPSGLPQHADQLEVPVTFAPSATTASTRLKLYYYNPALDQGPGGAQCSKNGLVAVERVVPKTNTPLKDSVELLLRGELSEEEKTRGITSEFPLPGVSLKSASLNQGVATLTFDDPQNKTIGGSCRVRVLWAQIEATAKQFSTVTSVRFMPDTLFQP
jgi:Immunoglobulin-like domain of bacterial spore germination/Sporulation and spore germination